MLGSQTSGRPSRLRALGIAAALLAAAGAAPAQAPLIGGEFLPPDAAFQLSIETRADGGRQAAWIVAEGYYLYRDKIKITPSQGRARYELPAGKLIHDEFFGETEVLRHVVEVPFTLSEAAPSVTVAYQGCADAGLCYPPTLQTLALAGGAVTGGGQTGGLTGGQVSGQTGGLTPAAPVSEQFRLAAMLEQSSYMAAAGAFLLIGILLAFTPCVLPMVPILLGILAGAERAPRRTFTLSLSYVLAMAATYSAFGVAMGLSGAALQAWLQAPAVLFVSAGVFVLMAVAMFGFLQLQLPPSWRARLGEIGTGGAAGDASGGASHTRAAVMGAVSALIVSPCVTPALIGALLFIARTGDAALGGVSLFALALGMGLPLLLLGGALGRWLPRPGPAMQTMQRVIGFLLLGVAVWLVDRVVPAGVTVFLSGVLLVLAGVALRGAPADADGMAAKLGRGVCAVLLLYGALLLTGAATGGGSLLQPLAHMQGGWQSGGPAAPGARLPFADQGSLDELERVVQTAEGRPVMLYFYADWCVSCKELEAFTFSDPVVRQALGDALLLRVDVTANDAEDRRILRRFGLFGPPAILFWDAAGRERTELRVAGFVAAEAFARHVEHAFRPAARTG